MTPDLRKRLEDRTLSNYDYNAGLQSIESFFEKQYNTTQTQWLYEQIKYLTKLEWNEVCEAARHQCEKMPTAKGLITLGIGKLRDAKLRRMGFISFYYAQKNIPNCNYCDHTGILSARFNDRANTQLYAYRCTFCDFANLLNLSMGIPLWDEEQLSKDFTPTFKRKLDATDLMWKDIYKFGGLKAINLAIRETPEKVWDGIQKI